MKDLLILIFVAICSQRIWKYRVKKTADNTSGVLDNDRIVTSVKDLWDMK